MTVTNHPTETIILFDMGALTRAVTHHQAQAISDSINRGFGNEAADLRQPPRFWPMNQGQKFEGLIESYQKQFILLSKRPCAETQFAQELTIMNATTLVSVGKALLKEGHQLAKIRDFADQFNQDLTTMLIPKIVDYQQAMDRLCDLNLERNSASYSNQQLITILTRHNELDALLCEIAFGKKLPPISDPNVLRADVLAKRMLTQQPTLTIHPPKNKKVRFHLASPDALIMALDWFCENGNALTGENALTEAIQEAQAQARLKRGQHLLRLVSSDQDHTNHLFGRWAKVLSLPDNLETLLQKNIVGDQALKDVANANIYVEESLYKPMAMHLFTKKMQTAQDGTGLSVMNTLIASVRSENCSNRATLRLAVAIDCLLNQADDATLATVLSNDQLYPPALSKPAEKRILNKNQTFWHHHALTLAFSPILRIRQKANEVLAHSKQSNIADAKQLEALIDQQLQKSHISMTELVQSHRKQLPLVCEDRLFSLTERAGNDASKERMRLSLIQACLSHIKQMPSVSLEENDKALASLERLTKLLKKKPLKNLHAKLISQLSAQLSNAICQRIKLSSVKAVHDHGFQLALGNLALFLKVDREDIERSLLNRLTQECTGSVETLDRLHAVANKGATIAQPIALAQALVRQRAAKRFIRLAADVGQKNRLYDILQQAFLNDPSDTQLSSEGKTAFRDAMIHKALYSIGCQWLASQVSEVVEPLKHRLPSSLCVFIDRLERKRAARQARVDTLRALPGHTAAGTARLAGRTVQGLKATPRVAGRMAFVVGVQAPALVIGGAAAVCIGTGVVVGRAAVATASTSWRVLSEAPAVAGQTAYQVGVRAPMVLGAAGVQAVMATGRTGYHLAQDTAGAIVRSAQAIPQLLHLTQPQEPGRENEVAQVNADDIDIDNLLAADPDLRQIFKRNALAKAVQEHRSLTPNPSQSTHTPITDAYAEQCYAMALRQPNPLARQAVGEHLVAYLNLLWADEGFQTQNSSVFETLVTLGNQLGNEQDDFLHHIFLHKDQQRLDAMVTFYERCPNRSIHQLDAIALKALLTLQQGILTKEAANSRLAQGLTVVIANKISRNHLPENLKKAVISFLNTLPAQSQQATDIALKLIACVSNQSGLPVIQELLQLLDKTASNHSPVFHQLLDHDDELSQDFIQESLIQMLRGKLNNRQVSGTKAGWGRVGLKLVKPMTEQQYLKRLQIFSAQVLNLMQDEQLSHPLRLIIAGYFARVYNDLTDLKIKPSDKLTTGLQRTIAQLQSPTMKIIQQATRLCQKDQALVDRYRGGGRFDAALLECAKALIKLSSPKALLDALIQGSSILAYSQQTLAQQHLKQTLNEPYWTLEDLEHIATDPDQHFDTSIQDAAGKALINRLLTTKTPVTLENQGRLLAIGCAQSAFVTATQVLALESYAKNLSINQLLMLPPMIEPFLKETDYNDYKRIALGSTDQKNQQQILMHQGIPYSIDRVVLERISPYVFVACLEKELSSHSELCQLNQSYVFIDNLNKLKEQQQLRYYPGSYEVNLSKSLIHIEALVKQKFEHASRPERVLMLMLTEDGRGMHEKLNAIASQVMS